MSDEQASGPAKPQDKRLRITGCSSVFNGHHTNGVEFTIYEVSAEKEDGTTINVPLRSFEELPLEVLDVTVTRYVSEKHGVSYTLARKNKGRRTRQRIDALEQLLDELTQRVARLETGGSDVGQQEEAT